MSICEGFEEEPTMVNYKLTYFDARGRAENIRCLFVVAGVPFEDIRITGEQWAELKPKTPFGTIPILEVDGQVIAQTTTILRFLGRQFGLAGKTPIEEALVEGIVDQGTDFMNEITPYFNVLRGFAHGDIPTMRREVFLPACEKHFTIFKKFIRPGSFIVGDSLSYADIHLAGHFNEMMKMDPELMKGHPEIEEYAKKIHSNLRLQEYFETRPDTGFFPNSSYKRLLKE